MLSLSTSSWKFLKAFLVQHNIDFEKVHSLEYLIKLCSTVDGEFENLYEVAEKLASYAIDIRYPDEFYIPSIKEAEEAFKLATFAKDFVLKKLNITEDSLEWSSSGRRNLRKLKLERRQGRREKVTVQFLVDRSSLLLSKSGF